MGFFAEDIDITKGLTILIKNFPGLEKYKKEIQFLTDNEAYANDAFVDGLQKSEHVYHVTGLNSHLLNTEDQAYKEVNEYLTDNLNFAKKLLADKELMEKEPFLKAYVGLYKVQLERSVSGGMHARDYMADDCTKITEALKTVFTKLPTGEEYKSMDPAKKAVADKILDYMDAYRDYCEYQGKVDRAIKENPANIKDSAYLKNQDVILEKLYDATVAFADIPQKDVISFFKDNNYGNRIEVIYKTNIIDGKHNIKTAIEQLKNRRLGINNFLTPEEGRVLSEYAGQVKNIIGEASAVSTTVKHLPEPFLRLTNEVVKLSKECEKRLKEGFASADEKREFFKNLGDKTSEYRKAWEEKIIPQNAPKEEVDAMYSIAQQLYKNSSCEIGAMNLVKKESECIKAIDKAKDANFKDQFMQFYKMMEKTGGGYFMHKNSKEYTNLMETAKVVAELSEKGPLNEIQKRALGECYCKLSKVTQEYLTDRKIGNKSTEVGEDRFAGALGILNLVDDKNGERLRVAAEARRGKEVSFEAIKQRAAAKGTDPKKKEPAKKQKQNANEKNDIKKEQKKTSTKAAVISK